MVSDAAVRTDGELLAAYVECQDCLAFKELHRRYAGIVYTLALRFLKNTHDAEDAAAACFVVLMRKAGALKNRETLGGWLHWCAIRTARNALVVRMHRAEREQEVYEMQKLGKEVVTFAIEEMMPQLEAALADLPQKMRDVLVMFYYQGLTRSQISKRIGKPEGTVATWISRGIAKLRKTLGAQGENLSDGDFSESFSRCAAIAPVPMGLLAKLSMIGEGKAVGGQVSALADRVAGSIFWGRIKVAGIAAAAVLGVGWSVLLVSQAMGQTEPPQAKSPAVEPAQSGGEKPAAGAQNAFNGAQEREAVYEFTQKPAVSKKGDKWLVTFTSKANCDATVSILGPDGKIINHLASGVLGKNAPAPFQQNSLAQQIEWDGKDDLGKPAPAGCKVHVGLGFKPVHGGIFLETKDCLTASDCVNGMTVAPDGKLYVHYNFTRLASVNRDATVDRYIMPMNAEAARKSSVFSIAERPDGGKFPLLSGWATFPLFNIEIPLFPEFPWKYGKGHSKVLGLAVTKSGDIYAAWRIFRKGDLAQGFIHLPPDGTMPKDYQGPIVKTFKGQNNQVGYSGIIPVWVAMTPDEQSLYISGTSSSLGGNEPYKMEHCIYKISLTNQVDQPAFAGEKGVAGSDDKHFNWPRGVACGKDGNVYVADYLNDRIVVLKPDGSFLKALKVERPECVGVGGDGSVYAVTLKFGNESKDLWKNGYPLVLQATKCDAKKLVKLSADGKVEATLELPPLVKAVQMSGHPAGAPMIAVDAEAKPAIIWVGSAAPGEPIWKVEDKGAELAKVATVPMGKELPSFYTHNATATIGASPYRDELYADAMTPKGSYTFRLLPDGTMEQFPVRSDYLTVMPDGTVWMRSSKNVLQHFDYSGKPIEGHKILPINWQAQVEWKGVTSTTAGRDGDLYVAYNLRAKDYGGAKFSELRGEPAPAAFFNRSEPTELWRFAADGTLKAKGVAKGFSIRASSVEVGKNGNVFVGDGDFEPVDVIPLGLAGVKKDWDKPFWKRGTGSVLKFGTGEAEIMLTPQPNYKPFQPATFKNLLWKSYCYSPNPSEVDGMLECACGAGRFSLDGYDRAVVPDIYTFGVHLLDANGNRICTFGTYGNAADRGPEISFQMLRYTAASRDAFWLADGGLNRIVKVNWGYAAEESVVLK